MSTKRTYFGFTTSQQRKLLFETWEARGNVTAACRTARVSRGLFYYWKPRFDQHGYAGLEQFDSRVAHTRHTKSAAVTQQVIALRQQHPDWGKARIAQELAKGHNWVPLASPNTVRRILDAAGLWPPRGAGKKRNP